MAGRKKADVIEVPAPAEMELADSPIINKYRVCCMNVWVSKRRKNEPGGTILTDSDFVGGENEAKRLIREGYIVRV